MKKAWIKNFIQETDYKKIASAVDKAESKTTGEIVPMIVRRSSIVHPFSFELFLIFLIIVLFLKINMEFSFFYVSAGAILSLALSYILAQFSFFQRLLIPKSDQHFQVFNRAQIEFYQNFSGKTKNNTAILIFISLLERKCFVLADQGIASKLKPETWDDVVALIIAGIKTGKTADGLVNAIQKAGDHLAEHFPANSHANNQLGNELIVKD